MNWQAFPLAGIGVQRSHVWAVAALGTVAARGILVTVNTRFKGAEAAYVLRASGAKAGISLKPKTAIEAILPYLQDLNLILVMSVEPGFGGQSFIPEMMEKIKMLRP